MPVGLKALLITFAVLVISLLPSTWLAGGASVVAVLLAFIIGGLPDLGWGVREFSRQIVTVKWVIVFTLVSQLIFTHLEPAVATTLRITSAIALAGLLTVTTPTTVLLTLAERVLSPIRWIGIDPQRVALLFAVTLAAIPALIRSATQVREAQRARGSRANLRHFTLAFLIVSLKHADDVGDALRARGAE